MSRSVAFTGMASWEEDIDLLPWKSDDSSDASSSEEEAEPLDAPGAGGERRVQVAPTTHSTFVTSTAELKEMTIPTGAEHIKAPPRKQKKKGRRSNKKRHKSAVELSQAQR